MPGLIPTGRKLVDVATEMQRRGQCSIRRRFPVTRMMLRRAVVVVRRARRLAHGRCDGCATDHSDEREADEPAHHQREYMPVHTRACLRRSELPITETELKLIAAAAIIGDSSRPNNGKRTPAAIGTPAEL